jgi:glyoxylase I family protein
MTGPRIHHVALRARDCLVSARFYEQAFGLGEIRRTEQEGVVRAIWLRAGDSVLMIERSLRGTGHPEGSGHVLIFEALSLDQAEKRLKAAGIPIVDRTPSTLFVEDPDGHRAGVSVHRFDQTSS